MKFPETRLLRLDLQKGVLTVRIDDPATRNAMSEALVAEFEAMLDHVENNSAIRVLVLRGTDGAFCAGGDIKNTLEGLAAPAAAEGPDPLIDFSVRAGLLFARLNVCPVFVIAVVDGPAMGGGLGLACCMDVVIAGKGARFGLPETTLGIPPSQIAPYVVARIGKPAARRLALTGQRLSATEAQAIGLVDHVAGPVEAEKLVAELAAMVMRCAPLANAETKRLILGVNAAALEGDVGRAAVSFAACLRGPEGREGVAAFAGKRPPQWAVTE